MVYYVARSSTFKYAVNQDLTSVNYLGMNTNVNNNNAKRDQPYKTPIDLTFINAAYRKKRPTTKAPATPSNMLADKNDTAEASRDFSFTTAGLDGDPYPTMISYPVAEEDYCDCIAISDADLDVDICTDNVVWGAIQIEYSDGTCNEVQVPVATMYASCTPDDVVENPDWYAYCELDFDYSLDDTSSIDQLAATASGQGSAESAAQPSPANTKRSIVGQIVTLTFVVLLAFQ